MKKYAEKIIKLFNFIYKEMQILGHCLVKKWVTVIGTLLLWPIICAFFLESSEMIHLHGKEIGDWIFQLKLFGDNIGLYLGTTYSTSLIILISYLAILFEVFYDEIKLSWKFIKWIFSITILAIVLYFGSTDSGTWYYWFTLFAAVCWSVLIIGGVTALISWCKLKLTEKMNNLSFYLTYHKNIQGPLITAIAGVFGTIIAAILSK